MRQSTTASRQEGGDSVGASQAIKQAVKLSNFFARGSGGILTR